MKPGFLYKKPDFDALMFARNVIDGRSRDAFDRHLFRLWKSRHGSDKDEPIWHHYQHRAIILGGR